MAGHCPPSPPHAHFIAAGFSSSSSSSVFHDYYGHPSTTDLCSTASGVDPLREMRGRSEGITNSKNKKKVPFFFLYVNPWGFPSWTQWCGPAWTRDPWRIISNAVVSFGGQQRDVWWTIKRNRPTISVYSSKTCRIYIVIVCILFIFMRFRGIYRLSHAAVSSVVCRSCRI